MTNASSPPLAGRGDRVAQAGVIASTALFGLSTLLLVTTLLLPSQVLSWTGPSPLLAFEVDRLAALLLVLVTGVATVVQAHARRFLRGEARQGETVLLALALTLATIGLVTSATLATLAVAWVLAGALTALLIGLRPTGRPTLAARPRTLLAGDLAFVAAVAVTTAAAGNVALTGTADLSRAAGELGPWLGPVALLVVVAVLARCAQLPLGAWLPGSVDAPTPVSALLHAGVINGGGILLLRASPILDAWPIAWIVLVAAATATAFVATMIMSVSTDVKGTLVRSTSAQMGFMLVTVAAGLPAAAVAHLIAHGMFKAGRFLGAGGAVHDAATRRSFPTPNLERSAERGRGVVAAGVALAAVTAGALTVESIGLGVPLEPSKVVLLGFATVTGAVVLHGWLRHTSSTATAIRAVATITATCVAYVAGIALLSAFLAPALTPPVGLGAIAFAPLVGATLAIWLTQRPSVLPARVRSSLHVAAINGTHLPVPTTAVVPGRRPTALPPTKPPITDPAPALFTSAPAAPTAAPLAPNAEVAA